MSSGVVWKSTDRSSPIWALQHYDAFRSVFHYRSLFKRIGSLHGASDLEQAGLSIVFIFLFIVPAPHGRI